MLLCGGGIAWQEGGATEDRYVAAAYGPTVDPSIDQVVGPAADPAAEAHYYTSAELDELVGPVALYPDDLVGLVLPASAYPLQIVEAARFLEKSQRDSNLQPDADWDDSVVALLNYPEVVALLNEDLDWTWRLGDAVINQQPDVIAAIGRLRERAQAAGNLRSDERQIVRSTDDVIEIVPADPEVIYVPYYEPERVIVYQTRPVYYYYPRPYPVYYYPYPVDYWFGSRFFWGVTTLFSISWHSHDVHVYHHWHHRHPYRWRHYDGHHYYRDHDRNRHVVRDDRHVSDGRHYRDDDDRWKPDRRRAALPIKPHRAGAVSFANANELRDKPVRRAANDRAPKAPDARAAVAQGDRIQSLLAARTRPTATGAPSTVSRSRGQVADGARERPATAPSQRDRSTPNTRLADNASTDRRPDRPTVRTDNPTARQPATRPVKSSDIVQALASSGERSAVRTDRRDAPSPGKPHAYAPRSSAPTAPTVPPRATPAPAPRTVASREVREARAPVPEPANREAARASTSYGQATTARTERRESPGQKPPAAEPRSRPAPQRSRDGAAESSDQYSSHSQSSRSSGRRDGNTRQR
jgi:hypothetical protein